MKRLIAFFIAFCFVLVPFAYAMPARAEETPWSTLFYSVDPENEGETGESGKVLLAGETLTLMRRGEVWCDSARAKLYVNGELCPEGRSRLEYYGTYTVRVESTDGAGAVTFAVQELPDFGFWKDHIFTEYPVITCNNAEKVEVISSDRHRMPEGEPIRQFGEFSAVAYGRNAAGESIKGEYRFFVRYCKSELGIDPASGKRALVVTVGQFEDCTVSAVLDGKPIGAGETVVTAVGQHSLTATVTRGEGEAEKANAMLMPKTEDLLLQIRVRLSTAESKEPYQLDFSEWDANIYLDGQPLSGAVRVTKSGTHTLTVRNADGTQMKGAFLLATGDEETLKTADSIVFTFRNPHRIYAWIAVVPAVLLLGAAVYLLMARRRVI